MARLGNVWQTEPGLWFLQDVIQVGPAVGVVTRLLILRIFRSCCIIDGVGKGLAPLLEEACLHQIIRLVSSTFCVWAYTDRQRVSDGFWLILTFKSNLNHPRFASPFFNTLGPDHSRKYEIPLMS